MVKVAHPASRLLVDIRRALGGLRVLGCQCKRGHLLGSGFESHCECARAHLQDTFTSVPNCAILLHCISAHVAAYVARHLKYWTRDWTVAETKCAVFDTMFTL